MRQPYLGLTRGWIVQAILSHVPRVTHGAGYTRTTIPAPAFDALRVFWAKHRRSAFAEWEIANLQRGESELLPLPPGWLEEGLEPALRPIAARWYADTISSRRWRF